MEVLFAGILAFASTNIDDVFILMLFFANKEFTTKQVVMGQYLGIIALTMLSLAGSLIGLLVAPKYVGLLGLLPIFFGIRNIIKLTTHKDSEVKPEFNGRKTANKTFLVAAVTVANGGDNIGIYVPLFAMLTLQEKVIVVSIFLLLVAVWCGAAWYLSKHPSVVRTIDKFGHIITPIVLILLGIYILFESGSFGLLF